MSRDSAAAQIGQGEKGKASKKARLAKDAGRQDPNLRLCRELFESRGTTGDMEFEVGALGEKIPAHSCVIKLRSDAWKAALGEGGFQESVSNKIHVEDADPADFLSFLEILYTNGMRVPSEGGLERLCKVVCLLDRYGIIGFGPAVADLLVPLLKTWGEVDPVIFESTVSLPPHGEYRRVLGAALSSRVPQFVSGDQDITAERYEELIKSRDSQFALLQSVPGHRGFALRMNLFVVCQDTWLRGLKKSKAPADSLPRAFKYLSGLTDKLKKMASRLAEGDFSITGLVPCVELE